jgi:hypothetical protein
MPDKNSYMHDDPTKYSSEQLQAALAYAKSGLDAVKRKGASSYWYKLYNDRLKTLNKDLLRRQKQKEENEQILNPVPEDPTPITPSPVAPTPAPPTGGMPPPTQAPMPTPPPQMTLPGEGGQPGPTVPDWLGHVSRPVESLLPPQLERSGPIAPVKNVRDLMYNPANYMMGTGKPGPADMAAALRAGGPE